MFSAVVYVGIGGGVFTGVADMNRGVELVEAGAPGGKSPMSSKKRPWPTLDIRSELRIQAAVSVLSSSSIGFPSSGNS